MNMQPNSTAERTYGSLHQACSAARRGKRGLLELARDSVDNQLRNCRTCPNDTDGDGDCGRPMCPVCGTRRQNTTRGFLDIALALYIAGLAIAPLALALALDIADNLPNADYPASIYAD